MCLPGFDEFIKSLGPDYAEKVISDVLRDGLEIETPVSAEQAAMLFQKAISRSYATTLRLLADYHRWLAESLAKQ